MNKDNIKKNILKNIPVILLPIVSYLILGPLEIFCGNKKDFAFTIGDFFPWFILMGVAILVVMSLILCLIPQKVAKVCRLVIFYFGLLSYIQYMFLNTKLSEADGSPMDWKAMNRTTIINTVIWIAVFIICIVLSILLKKIWDSIELYIPMILIAMQLVAIVSLIPNLTSKQNIGDLQMSGEKQFKVASNDNIVMFVMDTLGTQQLKNAMEEYPDLLDGFEDFTYYDNADCHYYCTFPSMTHILTGNEFDFNSESNEWLEKSWKSKRSTEFYDELHKKGYECNLYSPDVEYEYGNCSNLYGKFDNIESLKTFVEKRQLVKLLTKTSIYRYLPYILKPRFEVLTVEFGNVVTYEDGVAAVQDNSTFNQLLNEKSISIDDKMDKAFIVQHLFGTHKPYTTDQDGNYIDEAMINQTVAGCVNIFKNYINRLKELGLYESSTIILTADHGSWHGHDEQPILLIKKANEQHEEMASTSAPVSFDDFQATILEYAGIDNNNYGTAFSDWKDGDKRERVVYMRQNDDNYPAVEGSSFNVYYAYNYSTNKEELEKTVDDGPDDIIPATPWR